MEYELKLPQGAIQLILSALGEVPLKASLGVFMSIQEQVSKQDAVQQQVSKQDADRAKAPEASADDHA